MTSNRDISSIIESIYAIKHENPFVGLRSYEPDEGYLFFGRDKQIKDLLLKLNTHNFLSVVGSSGCGKSSLIKAGVIPRLKGGFLTQNRDHWLIAVMRPAGDPLASLAASISAALAEVTELVDVPDIAIETNTLKETGTAGFIHKMSLAFENSRFNLLILVDQFEELFTHKPDNEDKKNEYLYFVDLLLSMAKATALPIYIITTMRSEYIGHCNRFSELPELLNETQYLVPKLKWHQIREVIEYPIKLYGQQINPGLLDLLSNDSEKELDQLPVLQHCLMRTYQNWLNQGAAGSIEMKHYEETGGLKNAINQHAESVYTELSDQEKEIIKYLFQWITDVNADFEPVRRPQKLSKIVEICKAIPGVNEANVTKLINRFHKRNCAFLTPPESAGEIVAETVIDISHESLLRQWERLKDWIKEEQESARKFKWLSENVINKREHLRGIDLKDALNWERKQNPNICWASRYAPNLKEVKTYIRSSRKSNTRSKLIKRAILYSLIASILIILGAALIALNTKRIEKNYVTLRRDSIEYANGQLTEALTIFNKSDINNMAGIKENYKNVEQSYRKSAALYTKLLGLKSADTIEKINCLNEWQGLNTNIIDAVSRKINLNNRSWEENSFAYKTAAGKSKENVAIGERKYALAPTLTNKIDLSKRYGALAFKQLFAKDFKGTIASSLKGLEIYPQNDWIYTDLAVGYLMDKQFDKARELYTEYKDRSYLNRENSFRAGFRDDLNNLEMKKVFSADDPELFAEVQNIRKLLIR